MIAKNEADLLRVMSEGKFNDIQELFYALAIEWVNIQDFWVSRDTITFGSFQLWILHHILREQTASLNHKDDEYAGQSFLSRLLWGTRISYAYCAFDYERILQIYLINSTVCAKNNALQLWLKKVGVFLVQFFWKFACKYLWQSTVCFIFRVPLPRKSITFLCRQAF